MANSLTIEMISDWKKQQEVEAHNFFEKLRARDELNDLIMTKVNFIVETLSQHADATEIRTEVAALVELLQIRNSRRESNRKQVLLWM